MIYLLADNILETATVTATEAAGFETERLFDRNRGDRWKGSALADQDIDVDAGAAVDANALGLINHNCKGCTIRVLRGTAAPADVQVAQIRLATNADVFIVWSLARFEHWRVRILNPTVTPEIGELVLGRYRNVTLNPLLGSSRPFQIGNVHIDRTRTKTPFGIRLGDERMGYAPRWTGVPDADVSRIQTAFRECYQGAKNLVVVLPDGEARWMTWLQPEQRIRPVPVGGGRNELELYFEDAP